jgi:hypothetical protein
MIDTLQIRPTIARKIWITIRFIVFGTGGFVAVWVSWLSIMFAFGPPGERFLSPFVAVPLSLVGALMMLYGGGQWGRPLGLSMGIRVSAARGCTSVVPC